MASLLQRSKIKANQYTEPFLAENQEVIALALELDNVGKGLIDRKAVGQKT